MIADIPTRYVGEQHVKEDLAWIPSVKDWLMCLNIQPWMRRVAVKEKDVLDSPVAAKQDHVPC